MAITHEFTGSGGYDDVPAFGNGSMSWSHTSGGGSDCIVVIGFAMVADITNSSSNRKIYTPTVTYGSESAMFIGYSRLNASDNFGAVYWFALQNPPSGTQTVTVNVAYGAGTGQTLQGSSVSYRGVRSIHQVYQYNGTGSPASFNVSSVVGRKLVQVGAHSGTSTTGYSQNQLYRGSNTQSVIMGDADGASSVTFQYYKSGTSYGTCVIELVPSEEHSVVGIRSIGRAARLSGSSTTLSTSWVHVHQGAYASMVVAIVAVQLSMGDGTTTTCSVTFGGQAMTELVLTLAGTSVTRNAVGFYYLVNPPSGSSTVSVSTGGDMTKYAVLGESIVYDNVRSLADAGNVPALAVNVTGTPVGSQLLAVSANGNNLTGTQKTELFRDGSGITGAGDYGSVQIAIGTGGTVTFDSAGTDSVASTQVMELMPNIYKNNFFSMF